MRPTITFDKSFLQSLSVNEAVLFDFMFASNIPPVFLSETLADLEKEMKRGKLPEHVVGNLAHKTPEFHSNPNVHHYQLALGNLLGRPVPMDGRIMLPGGKKIALPGEKGVIYEQSAEAKALSRWQRGEFLEAEREHAKAWRAMINLLHLDAVIGSLNSIGIRPGNVRTLEMALELAGTVVASDIHPQSTYDLAILVLNIPGEHARSIRVRAQEHGNPPLSSLAPYAAYLVKIELFYYIAIAAKLLPAEKLTNRLDLSYLYYLPFCRVFVSGDKFHRTVTHLFLRDDQDFVWGDDLKAALMRLEKYASLEF